MPSRPKPPLANPQPRRRRRSTEAQDEFRNEILKIARRVYLEHGYDALSIRAVTEPLGVSQMAFYAYFPSKAALIRQLWDEMLQRQFDAILAAGAGLDSVEAVLRAHIDAYLAFWEAHPDQYRLFMVDTVSRANQDQLNFAQSPAYLRLKMLHRERVLACLGPRRRSSVDLVADMAFVKAAGYLHTTLGVGRYPFSDVQRLREALIGDIVAGVMRGSS